MDCLPIGQRHHAEDAGCLLAGARGLAPEANTAIRLHVATKGRSDHGGAPRRINIGPLASYPLQNSASSSYSHRSAHDVRNVPSSLVGTTSQIVFLPAVDFVLANLRPTDRKSVV